MVDFIRVFTTLGIPLAVIAAFTRDRTPQSVLNLLLKQATTLNTRLLELPAAYSVMLTYLNNIQAGICAHDKDIAIQMLDEAPLSLGPPAVYSEKATLHEPFIQFCKQAQTSKMDLSYPVSVYYEDMDAFVKAPSPPTRLFSQDPRGHDRRKAGQYLVAYNRGYYGLYADLPQKMLAYAQTQGISFKGPVYITCLLDEVSTADPNQFLSEAVVGVSYNKNR
jgi:hypothetical protein